MFQSSLPSLVRLSRLRPLLLCLLLSLLPFSLAACSSEAGGQPLGCSAGSVPCLSGTAMVVLQTSRGEVQISLDGAEAPLTAGNFVDLVNRRVYDNTSFHRVVRDPVPFVVQGGDPSSADPTVPAASYGMGSFLDPDSGAPRLIPLELKLRQPSEVIRYGQPLTAAAQVRDLALRHERGAVAMARSSDPNSASAQFYVALQPLPELDGRYAVFGRVIRGMEVIDRIQQGDRILRARLVAGGTLVQAKP
ncbi:MAG: peptidylprolyl isomerase [Synechococcus sp.]|nr:peptidylprolyl isomerase [Synechococcus sp.]